MDRAATVLSLDPGLTGGLAFFDIYINSQSNVTSVSLAGSTRMPTCQSFRYKTKKNARKLDVVKIATIINHFDPNYAFIELVSAMPSTNKQGKTVQGSASTFNFGYGTGMLEACVDMATIPCDYIQASAWKKYHGLIKTEKKAAVHLAHKYWPEFDFTKTTADSGRADAALIGFYGIQRYTANIIEVLNNT